MLQALSGIRCCFPAGKSGKCQSPWSNRYWQMSPALPTQNSLLPLGILHPALCPWNGGPQLCQIDQPRSGKLASTGSSRRKDEAMFLRQKRWDPDVTQSAKHPSSNYISDGPSPTCLGPGTTFRAQRIPPVSAQVPGEHVLPWRSLLCFLSKK